MRRTDIGLAVTLVMAASMVLAAGCGQTARPGGVEARTEAGDGAVPAAYPFAGEVVFVHPELGYVIVRGRDLPPDREQATLYRSGSTIGQVRFAGPRSEPFAAADVVEGQPQVGDQVRPRP